MLSADSLETLFQAFARRWSHKWEKTFADKKARGLWRHDLQALGVTDELLTRGLHKSAALDWPPSPSEFAALCHPTAADLGLPDTDTAYRRACVSHWSHPAVYEAARRVGTLELRSVWPESKSRPLFERAYRAVCDEVMAGAMFEAPKAPRIEHKREPWYPATQEEAKTKTDMLRGALGPMPGTRESDIPPEPINDVEFARILATQENELRQILADRGAA